MFGQARPKWWQLYLTFPLLIVLFMADSSLKLSLRGHQAVQIGIIVLVFGSMYVWLKASAGALQNLDGRRDHITYTVIEIPPLELPDTQSRKRPLLQIPESGIKGILSDTFEIDVIDAEFLPMDEPSQNRNEIKAD